MQGCSKRMVPCALAKSLQFDRLGDHSNCDEYDACQKCHRDSQRQRQNITRNCTALKFRPGLVRLRESAAVHNLKQFFFRQALQRSRRIPPPDHFPNPPGQQEL